MTSRLDPEIWMGRNGMPKLLESLGHGNSRFVGGAVRDWLLGENAADIDLSTPLTPQDVTKRLEEAGIKVIPTGIHHGTVTALIHGHAYEITTLRHDVATDGRHAEVAFTTDWQADAARRDFTINALYADPISGEISDWFGGLDDLARHHVRFIGDPAARIAEDHLRILRFFRFSARFGARIDSDGLAACRERACDLMSLSRERIRDELLKLLELPAPLATVTTMLANGILTPVLPKITHPADLARLLEAESAAQVAGHGLRRLAALLPADPETAGNVGQRLRLSNVQKSRLRLAACRTAVPADPRALAYRIGGDATLDRLLLNNDERAAHWAGRLAAYVPPRLPISGKDLIAMGLPPGPAVSRRLREVEEIWISNGFPQSVATTTAIARDVLGVV